jgi:hypothetical protein
LAHFRKRSKRSWPTNGKEMWKGGSNETEQVVEDLADEFGVDDELN